MCSKCSAAQNLNVNLATFKTMGEGKGGQQKFPSPCLFSQVCPTAAKARGKDGCFSVSTVESAGEQNVEIKIFRVLTPRLATSKLRQIPSSPSATALLALAWVWKQILYETTNTEQCKH